MYKVILFICFLFSFAFRHKPEATGGQIITDTVPTGVPQWFGGKVYEFRNYVIVDSYLHVMAGDTLDYPRYPALKFKGSNNRWYGHDRTQWQKLLFPGDTASLSNRINLKLNISDTAAMLSPYLRKIDTTAMLSPYINLAGYGLIKSGQIVRADTGATGLATQYDLTQVAVGASNGIISNSNVIQLGDLSTTSTATLTADRYLRSGNNSIYFQGNKINNGVANIIFDDSLSNPAFKRWMQINSLNHIAPPYIMGTGNVNDGAGGINHTWNFGFNLSPNNTRFDPNYCAIGWSMEGNYLGLQEWHQLFIDKQDIQRRISSFTIDTATKAIDYYHQITSWELKDVDAGAEPWVQFTGGQGGTTTNGYLYAGTTNQYRLQTGFSVLGGNTSASISSDGPGQRELHIDNSVGGWNSTFLPGMFSSTSVNSMSAQVLPATDGNLRLGDVTNKWLHSNAYYHRAVTGMRIGDFSSDQLPTATFEIYGPGNGTLGNIYIQNTTTAIGGIVVESPSGGHSFLLLKAQTGSGVVPQVGLIDQDDANFAAGMALERATSPILSGAQNDLLITNAGIGKHILFGTNAGAGRFERMRITSSGTVNIAGLATGGAAQMVTADATGNLGIAAIGNTLYTGSGSLSGNTTVTGAGNSLTFTSTRTGLSSTMNINNTSTGAGLIINTSGSGTAIEAGSSTGYGGNIFSSSGPGLQVSTGGNTGLIVNTDPASTNSIHQSVDIIRTSSGTPANNIGVSIDLDIETSAQVRNANQIISKWTTVTDASRTSQFEIWGVNAGSSTQLVAIAGNGNTTFGSTNSIVGTATNNNAVAGNIGEEVNSLVSTYTNYTTTATYQNITSITLTAGDWDLSAFFTFSANGATLTTTTDALFVISTTTASAAGAIEGQNIAYVTQAAPARLSGTITPYRVSLSATTTFYLNTQSTFTLGNPQFVGGLRARRMR